MRCAHSPWLRCRKALLHGGMADEAGLWRQRLTPVPPDGVRPCGIERPIENRRGELTAEQLHHRQHQPLGLTQRQLERRAQPPAASGRSGH